MKHNYYARLRGKVVVPVDDLEEVATEFQNPARYLVQTVVSKRLKIHVSTVFLVLNHGWYGKDQWFETMVFGGHLAGFQRRYETYDEALNGHEDAVRDAKLWLWLDWLRALVGRKKYE